ncbi:MAG: peptide-methionine (S)-S-oxide reductase MsrA [Flavitalea sp.]
MKSIILTMFYMLSAFGSVRAEESFVYNIVKGGFDRLTYTNKVKAVKGANKIVRLSLNNLPIPNIGKIKTDTATFAAGCFWCVEAQFSQLKGVTKVSSGYTGGKAVNPSYEKVCTGATGHAEACNIIYDPSVISYNELLEAFFEAHDPTQLNRQGYDVGTQYRSAIFYHNAMQKEAAELYIKRLNSEKAFAQPVVTAIDPFTKFYVAENYHQEYFALHGSEPYCKRVIAPKLDHFKNVFKDKLK